MFALPANMCWRALIPVNALPENHLEPVMNYWMGRRGHVVAYFVRGGALVNLVAVIETDNWVEESWSVEGRREDLLSAFPKAHRDLRILLERVERCFKWGLFDRDPLPHWGRGRRYVAERCRASDAAIPVAGCGVGNRGWLCACARNCARAA